PPTASRPGAEKPFLSPTPLSTRFGYSHGVAPPAERIVYIPGQVPLDSEGQLVGEGDFEAQTRQVFENLTHALEAAGASWSDVVKLNYFLTDVSRITVVRSIRDEYVDTKRPPASTLVQVSSLFRLEVMVEIEAVAVPN